MPNSNRSIDLEGPFLKVRRAKNQVQELRILERAFALNSGYQIVRREHNPKTGTDIYRVVAGDLPDPMWGVWVGEVAHNLRSALDALVHQLVWWNGQTPTNRTGFPIFLHRRIARRNQGGGYPPQFEQKRNGPYGRYMLRGVHPEHQALIERLQPYKRINRHNLRGLGRKNVLYMLDALNNADKHRLIQVVGAKPLTWNVDDIAINKLAQIKGYTDIEGGRPFVVLKDGAKFVEMPPNVDVHPRILPVIAFADGCEEVRNKGVVLLLGTAANHVEDILEMFDKRL